MTNNFSD